jgi:hypothetical protein
VLPLAHVSHVARRLAVCRSLFFVCGHRFQVLQKNTLWALKVVFRSEKEKENEMGVYVLFKSQARGKSAVELSAPSALFDSLSPVPRKTSKEKPP